MRNGKIAGFRTKNLHLCQSYTARIHDLSGKELCQKFNECSVALTVQIMIQKNSNALSKFESVEESIESTWTDEKSCIGAETDIVGIRTCGR